MVKRSKVCPPPQLSKLLRSKISKTVHPSAVQVPEEYTAILSRAISPGCTGTVNLTCHYLWVQLRAAAPLPNTAGSIYAAKWWDGTGKQSDRKKLRWIFFFFHFLAKLVYLISLLSHCAASPTNPGASIRKRMGIHCKRGVKPKHHFCQQPTLQAHKAQSQNQLIRMTSELWLWQSCIFITGFISCICKN